MKRDECNGARREIPMREAPQCGKCYILIPTVTLCYSHNTLEEEGGGGGGVTVKVKGSISMTQSMRG